MGGDSLDEEGSNNGPMAMLFLERKNASRTACVACGHTCMMVVHNLQMDRV